MSEFKFADNYNDLSVQSGVNAGFQFEFRCQRCGDTYRSDFVAYRSARASGWLGKAASVFGGVLGEVNEAVDGLAQTGWKNAHDESFKQAIEQAKRHFHRCARCSDYFCDACFSNSTGLCRGCAPDTEVEIEAARAAGEAAKAAELATLEGQARAAKRDVQRDRQLVCPKCGAEAKGAKFCPECGEKLAIKVSCPECSAECEPGTKFCPECGHRM